MSDLVPGLKNMNLLRSMHVVTKDKAMVQTATTVPRTFPLGVHGVGATDDGDDTATTLTLHQDHSGHWEAGQGATVWDAGLVLAKYVERRFGGGGGSGTGTPQGGMAARRVLELGTGTGVVGLVWARMVLAEMNAPLAPAPPTKHKTPPTTLGKAPPTCMRDAGGCLVMTDRKEVLPLTTKNALVNLSDTPSALQLMVDDAAWAAYETRMELGEGAHPTAPTPTKHPRHAIQLHHPDRGVVERVTAAYGVGDARGEAPSYPVYVVPLRWGDEGDLTRVAALASSRPTPPPVSTTPHPPGDLILGSDLLYDAQVLPALLHTLQHLAPTPHTEILLAYEERVPDVAGLFLGFFREVFEVRVIPKGEQDGAYASDDIVLLSCRRKV